MQHIIHDDIEQTDEKDKKKELKIKQPFRNEEIDEINKQEERTKLYK